MSETRTTGIEEQIMRSAGTLLYGHASAWDLAERGLRRPTPSRRIAASRRVREITAGMRLVRRRPAVAVDPRPCS